MLSLPTSPRTARTVRGLIGAVVDAVRSVIAPASLVEPPAVETVPDPVDVLAADELPAQW
ncbi:hypothetical protein OG762_40175 [Streptomyces sp. NBC_01136]|uniref:hypothetical protein n=1 Tax=Streptomyces sp. NBC_01136 TaxID=2903754 RepID=UPI003863B9B2|nr:hypothetical protein OG762_40175 [Streptomyces sp. NBC_01136]